MPLMRFLPLPTASYKWHHPGANDELFQITKIALQKAKETGLTMSWNLHDRSSLWFFPVARKKMTDLIAFVDECIGVEPWNLLMSRETI